MKRKKLLAKLEELANRLDIKIRYENLGQSRGGLCRLRGSHFIFINNKMSDSSKIDIISQEISNFDLSDVYLLPEIREQIGKFNKVLIS
ncbi:MAG: hypothetical protein ACLFSQ_04120 [Candidatus Zixiibacteriota bacterium]